LKGSWIDLGKLIVDALVYIYEVNIDGDTQRRDIGLKDANSNAGADAPNHVRDANKEIGNKLNFIMSFTLEIPDSAIDKDQCSHTKANQAPSHHHCPFLGQ